MNTPSTRVSTFGYFVATALCFSLHAEEPKSRSYKLRVDAPAKMEMNGEHVIAARNETQYTWSRSGQSRTLVVNQFDQKLYSSAREVQVTTMTRERLSGGIGGKTIAQILQDFDKALPETQAMLKCFDVPLVTLQLDQLGGEISRKVHAQPGKKDFADHLLLDALIFHSPFPGERTEWQRPFEMTLGEHKVQGPLTYKKVDAAPHTYAISGVLQDPTKKTQYAATGQQTFDPVTQEWTDGKLRFSVKSEGATKIVADMTLETTK